MVLSIVIFFNAQVVVSIAVLLPVANLAVVDSLQEKASVVRRLDVLIVRDKVNVALSLNVPKVHRNARMSGKSQTPQ